MNFKRPLAIILLLAVQLFVSAACTGLPATPPILPIITIPAFASNGDIPTRYTCSDENVSPAVRFNSPPQGTHSLAIIAEDPDAPGGLFIHWVIYNIPPTLSGLIEAIPPESQVPGIGTQGKNSFGASGYGGPCPPAGSQHHYHFRAYALDLAPNLPENLTASQLRDQMKGHVLAAGDWVGLYKR